MSHRRKHVDKKELEKLNIENLFATDDNRLSHCNGNLDINTLFGDIVKIENYEFDSQILLDGIFKKRQKLNECYTQSYKNCCETIISANNVGLTDIIYDVPKFMPDCIDYVSLNCLKFIEKKLHEQKISILPLSQTKMFITWINLEEKITNISHT